jgi:HSP20 family protein
MGAWDVKTRRYIMAQVSSEQQNDKSSSVPISKPSGSSIWNEPFHGFRAEMDHLFERFFGHSPMASDGGPIDRLDVFNGGSLSPDIDVRENDNVITLAAELPGMEEKDIDLTVDDGVLTLKGEKRYEHEEKEKGKAVRIERQYGSFQRSFTLPSYVDEEKVSAKFDKGVLTIELPKKPGAPKKGRSIPIG